MAARPDTAEHFSRHAGSYATSPSHASGEDLDIVEALAGPQPTDRCLDVATGAGHTALRLARSACLVVGTDIALGMIAASRRLAEARGLANVLFHPADVAALPFTDGSFDLVTCRIAPHHFHDLGAALKEIARVLKPSGRFVMEDSLAPEDSATADVLERLEKRRDPTHVHTLSGPEWYAAFEQAGMRIAAEQVYRKTHDFVAWLRRVGLNDGEVDRLTDEALTAPPAVRDALFEVKDGHVLKLRDRKLIARLELAR